MTSTKGSGGSKGPGEEEEMLELQEISISGYFPSSHAHWNISNLNTKHLSSSSQRTVLGYKTQSHCFKTWLSSQLRQGMNNLFFKRYYRKWLERCLSRRVHNGYWSLSITKQGQAVMLVQINFAWTNLAWAWPGTEAGQSMIHGYLMWKL